MQPLYEYVCHVKGNRNSKGELAEWVIKSHKTGKILSSHKSEKKAKEHLQQMHIFKEAAEASERKKGIPVIVCADMGMGKTTFVQKINDSGKYKCYDLEVCDLPNIWGEPDEDGNMALVDGWEDIALKKIKSLDADVVAITSDPKMVNKLIESGIPFFLAYKDDISAIRKDIEKRTSEHFANVVKDFWKYIEKSDIPEELKEQMKECDPKAMTNIKCADALPPSIIETDKFQSDDRYRHWHDMFKLKTGGKAVSIMDRNIETLESRLKEFGKITSNLCTKLRLNAGEYLSSQSILHKILDRVEERRKKSDKLLGESTNGNTMDKRFNIFMENVAKLGLSKNQLEAVGNITKVCLEGQFNECWLGNTPAPQNPHIGPKDKYWYSDINREDMPGILHKGVVYELFNDNYRPISTYNNVEFSDWEHEFFELYKKAHRSEDCTISKITMVRLPNIDTSTPNPSIDFNSITPDENGNALCYQFINLDPLDGDEPRYFKSVFIPNKDRDSMGFDKWCPYQDDDEDDDDNDSKIAHAKHELEERDNMSIPAEAFRDWDNGHGNEEIGSMDFGDVGNDGDLGEIGKIGEDQDEQPEF